MAAKQEGSLSRGDRFFFDPEYLTIIGLDTKDGKEHPLYDERVSLEVDSNTVASIKVYGVIEDVVVRRNGDAVEVVDGRQRVKAARVASKELKKEGRDAVRVPVTIRKDDDKGVEAIGVLTNEQRHADSPLIKAQKAQRMLDHGHSEDAVAMVFGVTKPYLKQLLSLLDLAAPVRKAVESGEVSASAASKLSKLKREDQVAKLGELTAKGGKVTAKDTKKAANPNAVVAPGKALIRAVYENLPTSPEKATLAWVLGVMGNEDQRGVMRDALDLEAQDK